MLLLSREASTPFQSLRADMKLGKKCNGDFFRGDGTRLKSFFSYLNPPSRCWASTFLIKSILLCCEQCFALWRKVENRKTARGRFPGFPLMRSGERTSVSAKNSRGLNGWKYIVSSLTSAPFPSTKKFSRFPLASRTLFEDRWIGWERDFIENETPFLRKFAHL